MRYHFERPSGYTCHHGRNYICEHPVYSHCTLYKDGNVGLAVIQQRFDPNGKRTWWGSVDPWVAEAIYQQEGFRTYFEARAGDARNGVYPTVTVRQIMWALRMKPLPKARWETVFDRKDI